MSLGLNTAADTFGFLGARGSDNFQLNDRPGSFRESLLIDFPVGNLTLVGLTSMMDTEQVDDPKHTWFQEELALQKATFTAGQVFTDAGLTAAYSATGGAVAGDVLFIKFTSASNTLTDLNHFRVGHQGLVGLSTNNDANVNVEVIAVQKGTTTSSISIKLLEDDDNGSPTATNNISDADTILISGNINEELSPFPNAITYDPNEFFNFTQIFITPYKLSRTNRMTRARTEDSRAKAMRQTFQYHGIEMEQAFMHGERSKTTGDNGLPKRSLRGLRKMIETDSPAINIDRYSTNTSFSGKDWKAGGKDWLDERLEIIFRQGEPNKVAMAGNAALLGINQLAEFHSQLHLETFQTEFGHQVRRWVTPFGTINILTHPLMTRETMFTNDMVIFEPEQLKYRFITDTVFLEGTEFQTKGGQAFQDGEESGFLTEGTLELHNFNRHGILKDVGKDNTV